MSGVTRCRRVEGWSRTGDKNVRQTGRILSWKIPITISIRERIRFTVALITSFHTLGPFDYNGWIGALTTEGHNLFTLIKHHQTHGDKTPLLHIIDPGQLRVKGSVYWSPLNSDVPSLPLSFTLYAFEMVSRVKRHDSHVAGHLHDLRCHYSQKDPSYTPPCPGR